MVKFPFKKKPKPESSSTADSDNFTSTPEANSPPPEEDNGEAKSEKDVIIPGKTSKKRGLCSRLCGKGACGCYKTKEEIERIKFEKEQKEIHEAERKDCNRELDDMASEEMLSWDAYTLPERNCKRLIALAEAKKKQNVAKAIEAAKLDAESKEEGATYHNSQLKEFKRYKASPALHKTFEGHKSHIHAFKLSPDYKHIISASADFSLRLWDAETTKCLRAFEGHTKAVRDVDIIPGFNMQDENRLFVSASSDKTLRMWDARSDQPKRVLKGHTDVVYGCAFHPDGERFLSCSEDCTIRLWSAHEGHVIYVFRGHESAVLSACFSPGGRYMLSSSDYGERQIKMWHTMMPVIRKPMILGQRVFFTKSGLIKKIVFTNDPDEEFFKEIDEDELDEALMSSDEEDDDKKKKSSEEDLNDLDVDGVEGGGGEGGGEQKNNKNHKKKKKQEIVEEEIEDVIEKDGFSINVLSEGRFGKLVECTAYYPGQELIVVVRGVKEFQVSL